jgi:anti-sigma B factor antagonist
MPEQIDAESAPRIGMQLGVALVTGATVVIADFSATTFCDCSGLHEVAQARQQALAMGAELLLVATSAAVLQVLAVTEMDKLMPVYDSVAAAEQAHAARKDSGG